jgi:hypothetical protein
MKNLLFFTLLLISVACFFAGCAGGVGTTDGEKPKEIHIGFNYDNFVLEAENKVSVGERIVFIRDDNEEYAIIVPNAKQSFEIDRTHLVTLSDSSLEPGIFPVVDVGSGEYPIIIYCISKNQWNDPDAPPRIIINSE